MIKINKGAEPKAWEEHRTTPGATYEPKPELRESLLQEQGYICAYCMQRIRSSKEDAVTTTKIEHLAAQSKDGQSTMDYSNMVICCLGRIDKDLHCDTSKENQAISIDLFSDRLEEGIKYQSKDGTVVHKNEGWDREINAILNLNHPMLKLNRKDALNGLIAALKKKLQDCENPNAKGKLEEYSGILRWYLRKKLPR